MDMIDYAGIAFAILAFLWFGYRHRWGCRFHLHTYVEAFPATHYHGICTKCGKRIIPAKNNDRRHAPIDLQWLETGRKSVMGPPIQPPRKPRTTERKEDV